MNIKKFLSANGLKQKDLVQYLGISKPFASQITKGTAKLGSDKLTKLLSNPYGWDTSALTNDSVVMSVSATDGSTAFVSNGDMHHIANQKAAEDIARLKARIAQLEGDLKKSEDSLIEEKSRSERYLKMIENLTLKQ